MSIVIIIYTSKDGGGGGGGARGWRAGVAREKSRNSRVVKMF